MPITGKYGSFRSKKEILHGTWLSRDTRYPDKISNLNNRQIDVVFKIKESEKYYLESVTIDGNTKSKQRVIIRELALKPGDVFDYKRMEASEMRLKNTNYFDRVRLRPEPTNIPCGGKTQHFS